jgi:quercetin dioxygenase-like cupin family protein
MVSGREDDAYNRVVHITRADQRPLQPTATPGIERGRLWDGTHGLAVEYCRMRAGAVYGRHPHRSWEQMFVVSGKIDVDGTALQAGDYALTEPGEWHEVRAIEDCVVLLSFGRP